MLLSVVFDIMCKCPLTPLLIKIFPIQSLPFQCFRVQMVLILVDKVLTDS